jgi:hypothetical protein
MSTWTSSVLAALENAAEVSISTRRPDGTLRPPVPIWVVRAGDDIYIRSYQGTGGAWHRHARRQGNAHVSLAGLARDVTAEPACQSLRGPVDAAYQAKYASYGHRYVTAMTSDSAAGTTTKITPTSERKQL